MNEKTVILIARLMIVWGVVGGWYLLGCWWPPLNTLTKDQFTIGLALVMLIGQRDVGSK